MAITRFPLRAGFGSAVFASQSWNWLTERFAYPPQVRRFFDEKSTVLARAIGNFQHSEDLTPPRY
jgi:hypothetical protein